MKDEMLRQLDKEFERKNLTKPQYDELRADILSKAEQLEKLMADHQSGNIDDATFEKWSVAIGEDYREIGERREAYVDKNIETRKKKAENKYKKPFIIGFLAIVLAVGSYWLLNYLYTHRSINDVPEPVQVMLSEAEQSEIHVVLGKDIGRPEYTMNMNYLASYDIKGIVLGTKHFGEDSPFDMSFPVDVGMAWGEAAAHRGFLDCTNGPRKLSCTYDIESVIRETNVGRGIMNMVSNNHLTPADKDVYNKIMQIRAGNYIELKGYLVGVVVTDKDGNEFSATSSLTRDDHMDSIFDTTNTGCEIFYVTSVEWLD